MKTILFIGILITSPVLFAGQLSREEGMKTIKSKLLDAPSAAYKLSASYNGSGYEFCNNSDTRVVKFRLGCVEKKNGELKILSKRKIEEIDLPPADENHIVCKSWSSNHGFFPGEVCKKGKLAIVEVTLANGAVWNLKP